METGAYSLHRHHMEEMLAPFPKSKHVGRIISNFHILTYSLSLEDQTANFTSIYLIVSLDVWRRNFKIESHRLTSPMGFHIPNKKLEL